MSDGVRLLVRVSLNAPQVLGSIRVGGTVPVAERKIRKWLRQGGIRPGKRLDRSAKDGAKKRVVEELRRMGWDRARVNLLTRSTSEDNEIAVSVLIRPGPRLMVEATGRKLLNKLDSGYFGTAGDTVSEPPTRCGASTRGLVRWEGLPERRCRGQGGGLG